MVGLSDITSSIDGAKALGTADPATLGGFKKGLQAGVQNFCKAYGNNEAVFNLSFLGAAADEICSPYFAQQGLPSPSSEPPYTGGQCPVQYLVKTSGQRKDGLSPWTDLEVAVVGPLGEVAFSKPGDGFGVFIRNGAGNLQAISPYTTPFNEVVLTAGPTVRRADNQPDNCGNPDPVFNPSGGPNYNFGDNITVNNDNGTTTNVVVGAPTLSVNGQLNIPVNVGGVEVNLGGGSPEVPSGEQPPVGSGDPIPGGDLAEDGGDFPNPPPGTRYVGAAWRLTATSPGQPPIPGSALNKSYPTTVGNFALKVRSDNGETFATPALQIRSDRGYVKEEGSGLTVVGAYANVKALYQIEVIPLTTSEEPQEV